jgi:hypothetical protein
MPVTYPVPWDLIFGLSPHFQQRTQEDIAEFTRQITERMQPRPALVGLEHIPPHRRFVLAANHYQRQGLWILHTAAAITQALVQRHGSVSPPPVRWIVTANWPPIRLGPVRIPSPGDILLPRIAHVLHCYPVSFAGQNPEFTARSIRRILRDARQPDAAPIGIFPEGVAGVAGQLTDPLPGVDRLLAHLAKSGWPVVPCGITESAGLELRFGPAIEARELVAAPDAARLAMSRIAALLGSLQ